MIDRTCHSQRLTTIVALALAFCVSLDVGARPTHALDNFPCSNWRDLDPAR